MEERASANKKNAHRDRLPGVIRYPESNDRVMGSGQCFPHEGPITFLAQNIKIIQLRPPLTVAQGTIHASLFYGLQDPTLGEFLNQKGCRIDAELQTQTPILMKIGCGYAPSRFRPGPPAIRIQDLIPFSTWVCYGDLFSVDGRKARIITGQMENLRIRGCVHLDGAILPDPRSLFWIIPKRETSSLVDIINHLLERGDPLIPLVGVEQRTSEGVIVNNGQHGKDHDDHPHPAIEALPPCEYEPHKKGNKE